MPDSPATPVTLGATPLRFSVIIPTYRRERMLAECLDAVCRVIVPPGGCEIIVLDDGTDDDTRRVVEVMGKRIRYVPGLRRSGPAGARNKGAAQAQGMYLAFLDDDCRPHPGWLEALDRAFTASGDEPVMLGGCNVEAEIDNYYARASQLMLDQLHRWHNHDPQNATFFPSNNIAVPRAAYWSIRGFDGSFPRAAAEDRDFCERWCAQGYRMVSVADAVIAHHHRTHFDSYWRQHFGYGAGLAVLHAKRDERGSNESRLHAFAFYRRLLTAGLKEPTLLGRVGTTGLLGLAQVATAAGYVWQKFVAQRRAPRM